MAASKDVGANCFLNSPYKEKIFGPNPSTTRGEGTQVSFHPKENSIVYPSGRYIIFKNLDRPSDCFIYRGHNHTTTVAKVSPNGYWVASGDVSGKLRVWSWDNPEHLTKLEYPAFSGPIHDIDWGDESKKIVVVGEGSGVMAKVITWDTGNSAGEMLGHSKRILSCAFKPTRPYRIFSCAEDFKVCFFSGPPFKLQHSRQPFTNFANCIRYSPDGKFAVCVGEKKIQLFDGATGEETICVEKAHEGTVYSASWNPDSTKFATAAADKTVKVWNLALECLVVHSFANVVGEMQVSVCWTKTSLVSVALNGNITVLNTEAAGPLGPPLQDHQVQRHDSISVSCFMELQNSVSCMCYDQTTNILYTGDNFGVILSRNIDT